ncbi:hypothetical protein BC827DRAFT_1383759 [Russula dissimulans]|nr:hypothetical protein BC827DRAFT_1383759 [Russula dissimulans]
MSSLNVNQDNGLVPIVWMTSGMSRVSNPGHGMRTSDEQEACPRFSYDLDEDTIVDSRTPARCRTAAVASGPAIEPLKVSPRAEYAENGRGHGENGKPNLSNRVRGLNDAAQRAAYISARAVAAIRKMRNCLVESRACCARNEPRTDSAAPRMPVGRASFQIRVPVVGYEYVAAEVEEKDKGPFSGWVTGYARSPIPPTPRFTIGREMARVFASNGGIVIVAATVDVGCHRDT